jgi:hypothetical protein
MKAATLAAAFDQAIRFEHVVRSHRRRRADAPLATQLANRRNALARLQGTLPDQGGKIGGQLLIQLHAARKLSMGLQVA